MLIPTQNIYIYIYIYMQIEMTIKGVILYGQFNFEITIHEHSEYGYIAFGYNAIDNNNMDILLFRFININ